MTGAINAYILVICGIILTFYSIMMFVKTKDYKYFLNILALSIPALISMYISGAFNMNAGMQELIVQGYLESIYSLLF